jgi:hypothetical protein
MNEILINRQDLQRLLEKHFQLTAENAAYLTLMNRACVDNLELAQRYVTARLEETEKQLAQTQGLQTHMTKALAAGDDEAFRLALSHLCPPRSRDEGSNRPK